MTTSFSDFSSANPKNKIETLALFSKAAYAVQDWENVYINDPSPRAVEAYTTLRARGWETIDFDIRARNSTFESSDTTFSVVNKMENGYFTHANAAALVARSDDTLVISFRGTNDSDDKGENELDPSDDYHPDKDHWAPVFSLGDMTDHYRFFNELFEGLNQYVNDNSGIQKIYVTGHSMGGAMAIEYMSRLTDPSIKNHFEVVVFAAAPFVHERFLGAAVRKDYRDDARILQIEISGDPVADSWDYFSDNNRPGQRVKFHGDQTMDTPNLDLALHASREANHSMNYYLEMVSNVDSESWQYIVAETSLNQTAEVLIGGQQQGSNYIVATQADNLSAGSQGFIYGGANTDSLRGGSGKNFLLGGDGNDILTGGGGDDFLLGGRDIDTAMYQGIAADFTIDLSTLDGEIRTSVKDRAHSEGTDTLAQVEFIDFSGSKDINLDILDGVMNLDAAELRSLVEVYIASFSRAPDAEGLYYWADRYSEGMSLQNIAKSFFDQTETQSIYGGKSNTELVSTVYQNFLGRDAEQAGKNYWVSELDKNLISTDSFLLAVINGAQADDRSYINDKADLGVYFSAILGMNNVEAAYDVMSEFTGSAASLDVAKAAIDDYHTAALATDNGELLIRIVGVIDDPFVG